MLRTVAVVIALTLVSVVSAHAAPPAGVGDASPPAITGGEAFALQAGRASDPVVTTGQETAPVVQAPRLRVPQLSLQVSGADAARLGGTGAVSAMLIRRSADGVAVSQARVRLVAPPGLRMIEGTGAGWSCAAAGRALLCSHPGRIPAGTNPAVITATFSVAPTAVRLARAATAEFEADATWSGDPARATIGGPWLETDTGTVDVRDALRGTLVSASGSRVAVTTGLGDDARRIDLAATVTGGDTGQVRAEWFQVAGPAVRFAGPATVDDAADQLTQGAIVPDTASGTQTYVFGLRLSGDGDVVERRVAVQVVADRVLPRQAFDQTQIERLVDIAQRNPGDRTLVSRFQDDFDISGPTQAVRPGTTVRLRLVNVRVPLVQTGWIVNDRLVTAPKTNPQRLTVKAPSLGASTSVEVIAVDRKGKVYSEGIVITGGQPVGRSGRSSPSVRQAKAATEAQQQAMCDTVYYLVNAIDEMKQDAKTFAKAEIQDTLPGGLTLWMPAAKITITSANGNNMLWDPAGDCKTATIAFEDARLELDPLKGSAELAARQKAATFSAVKGGYTALDGLRLTEATWAPDVPYTKYVPTAGKWEGSVTAAFTGPALERTEVGNVAKNPGELAALTGQFHSKAGYLEGGRKYAALIVSQIKLPGGYTILDDSARISFLNEATDQLPDGTVRISEQFTNAPENTDVKEYTGGRIAINIDRVGDRYATFGVTVSNMVLGETAGGDTIEITGTGTKAFSDPNALVGEDEPGSSIKLRVGCYRVEGVGYYAIREIVATCEVFKGLAFKEFNLDWSAKKLALSGQVEITAGSSTPVRLGVAGEYVSAQDWNVSVSGGASAPWSLDGGLRVRDITGSIGRKPKAPDSEEAVMTAGLRGVLDGISFAEGVDGSLGAEITNDCPKETKQPGATKGDATTPPTETPGTCNVGDIKLRITGQVTAQLTKTGNRDTIYVDGAYDFGRKRFRVQASYTGTALRVDGLGLKDAHLIVTNEKEQCVKKGQEPDDTGRIKVQIAANLDVLNQPVGVSLMTGPSGVCLVGQRGSVDLKGGLKTKDGTVAFSDYTGGADIFVGGKRTPLTKERALTMQGSFEFPSDISTSLKTDPTKLTYMASLSTQGAAFELAYVPQGGAAVLYQSKDGNTSLQFTRGVFNVEANWANGLNASVSLAAEGSIETKAGSDGTVASSTPVGARLALAFQTHDAAGNPKPAWSIEIGVGANIEQGKSVENAFGQQGMTLRGLYVAAKWTLPSPAPGISVYADATLPDYMGRYVGLVNDAPVKFAAKLDLQTPCFDIQVGSEGRKVAALDLANKGVITARYLRMYLAPWGCEITANAKGEKLTIPAGWGFQFDGNLFGGELSVAFGSQLTPQVFRVKTDLNLPAIDLVVVSLTSADQQSGAKFKIDIDTAAKRYNFDVDAAIEIGRVDYGIGAKVAVKGSLKTDDPDKVTFDIVGSGGIKLTPLVRGEIKTLRAKGSISKGTDKSKDFANGTIAVEFYVLGQTLKIDGDVDYRNGQLERIQAQVGADFNILIARLDGQLNFDYCLGKLDTYRNDGSRPVCTLYTGTAGASPQIRVGVRGTYRILWWTKDYTWVPYDQPGKEGSAPPIVQEAEPLVIPGDVPAGLADDGVTADYLKATGGDLSLAGLPGATNPNATFILKATKGKALRSLDGSRDVPACDASRLGAVWQPTGDAENPAPAALDPVAQKPGEACGLVVGAWTSQGSDRTGGLLPPLDVVCDAGQCVSVSWSQKLVPRGTVVLGRGWNQASGSYDGRTFSANDARDKLLAGLRVPPGLFASPMVFNGEERILAGDGTTAFVARPFKAGDRSGVVELQVKGKTVWKVDVGELGIQGLRFPTTMLTRYGTFKVCWSPGGGYRGGDADCPNSSIPLDVGVSIPVPANANQYPVALVRNGSLFIFASPNVAEGNILWGVKSDGSCFVGKLVTNASIPANFCKQLTRTPYRARP